MTTIMTLFSIITLAVALFDYSLLCKIFVAYWASIGLFSAINKCRQNESEIPFSFVWWGIIGACYYLVSGFLCL